MSVLQKFRDEVREHLKQANACQNRGNVEQKILLRQSEEMLCALFEGALETILNVPATSSASLLGVLRRVEERIITLHEKADTIMSSQADINTLLGQMNTATNQVADRITLQTKKITDLTAALAAAGTITPEEQAALDATVAALQTEVSRLNALAADTSNPIPPAVPATIG